MNNPVRKRLSNDRQTDAENALTDGDAVSDEDQSVQDQKQLDSTLRLKDETAGPVAEPLDTSSADLQRGEECIDLIQNIRVAAPHLLEDLFDGVATDTGQADDQETDILDQVGDAQELDDIPQGVTTTLADDELDRPPTIGRFQIIRELGRGGNGVVFLCEDPELKRLIALKVPRPEVLMTADLRKRFLREGEAAASLNHPNIIPVYEAGNAGPIHYIASAYCAGLTLRQWLDREGGKIDAQRAARLVAVLVAAVEHAHGRGVLHRDIKPSNVMLELDAPHPSTKADESPEQASRSEAIDEFSHVVKLTDFGLARTSTSQETLTSDIVGTPAYMAPEQAAGDNSAVTVTADIYALGVVLYQLLAGRPPFHCKNRLDTLLAVRTQEPEPLRRHDKSIPRDIEAICLKCLEKDPAGRYATASELRADLVRFLAGQPVVARPVSTATRAARWLRRRPMAATGILAASVLLAIAAGSVIWQWNRAEKNLQEARRQRQRAVGHLHNAQAAVDELLSDVSVHVKNVPQMEPLRRSLLTKALEFNERFINDEAADEAMQLEVMQAMERAASMHIDLGDVGAARKVAEKNIRLGESMMSARSERNLATDDLESWVAAAYRRQGICFQMERKFDLAYESFLHALNTLGSPHEDTSNTQERSVDGHCDIAELQRLVGISLEQRGQLQEAHKWYQDSADRMRRIEDRLTSAGEAQLATSLNSLGISHKMHDRFDDAMTCYLAACELLERLVMHTSDVSYRNKLASQYTNMTNLCLFEEDYPAALEYAQLSGQVADQLAADFPLSPHYRYLSQTAHYSMGLARLRMQSDDEAIAPLQKAAEISEALIAEHPRVSYLQQTAKSQSLLGDTLRGQGDLPGSIAALTRATEIGRSLLTEHPEFFPGRVTLADALQRLAETYCEAEQYEMAEDALHEAIEVRTAAAEEAPHLQTELIDDYGLLGSALLHQDRFDETVEIITKLEQFEPSKPNGFLCSAGLYGQLAWLLKEQNTSTSGGLTAESATKLAIERLEELFDRQLCRTNVLGDPSFDALRHLPEFQALRSKYAEN